MNELKEYYETSFAPTYIPLGYRQPFEELDESFVKSLERSYLFTSWKAQKTLIVFFAPAILLKRKVVRFLGPTWTRVLIYAAIAAYLIY